VKDTLLPVAHVFAMVMMVFAVDQARALIMAIWGSTRGLWSFILSRVCTFVLGALFWPSTRRSSVN